MRDKPPSGDDWVYELKYDGYRIVAYKEGDNVRLLTRNKQDYSDRFPTIVNLVRALPVDACVLDGEMVVMKDGRTDFSSLQRYIKQKKGAVSYVVFDLLAYEEHDLREQSLEKRKRQLKTLLASTPPALSYSEHTSGDGAVLLAHACEAKMEGIICKRLSKPYTAMRSSDWIKVKCRLRQEFVIVGYTQTEKRRNGVSALLLGFNERRAKDPKKASLLYAGRAGTGFSESLALDLEEKLKPLIVAEPKVDATPRKRSGEETFWVEPTLVAEIEFAEWTNDNLLRQASFKGLRGDKAAHEVFRETQGEIEEDNVLTKQKERLTLTSPDKEMFAGVTKKEVAAYYEKMAKRMLPHLAKRLLSLVRCPDGEHKDCFFQRHLREQLPGMEPLQVKENDGDESEYFYLADKEGLHSAVQYGTLEFHTWGSKVDHLEKPDMLVFDLDPDEGMTLDLVRQAVLHLKSILDDLDLTSFLKTSGGKGYHVVVPLEPHASWQTVRTFAQNVAKAMEAKWPKLYTSNMRKEKRKGKVFIDWIRNGRSATSVAPYSLRARAGAPISCPIAWSELAEIGPADITLTTIAERSRKQPWRKFFSLSQRLSED